MFAVAELGLCAHRRAGGAGPGAGAQVHARPAGGTCSTPHPPRTLPLTLSRASGRGVRRGRPRAAHRTCTIPRTRTPRLSTRARAHTRNTTRAVGPPREPAGLRRLRDRRRGPRHPPPAAARAGEPGGGERRSSGGRACQALFGMLTGPGRGRCRARLGRCVPEAS